MPLRSLALRVLCLLSLSIWTGGFTFYSAVVIPVLHESLGSLDTGFVTQQVTDCLNFIGVGVVLIWWIAAWVEREAGRARVRSVRLLLLAATTVILVGLIVLHRVMDGRLETGGVRNFYPLHRVYLDASTVQWFLNLGLITTLLVPPRLEKAT
ncbi:MAG: hypothetical protein ABS79_06870 [Planctomycetes bacterium SCN 63-9]|nr:MAG: hypothetical protein ABS79_06870 [Planctomycetes bacterium SCN 63-9]